MWVARPEVEGDYLRRSNPRVSADFLQCNQKCEAGLQASQCDPYFEHQLPFRRTLVHVELLFHRSGL